MRRAHLDWTFPRKAATSQSHLNVNIPLSLSLLLTHAHMRTRTHTFTRSRILNIPSLKFCSSVKATSMQQQQQHRREAEHLRRTYARKKTLSSVRPRRCTPAPTQTQTRTRRAPTLDSRSIPSPPFICGDSETQNYPSDLAAAADAVAVRDQSFGIGRQRRYRRSSETVFFRPSGTTCPSRFRSRKS